MMTSTAWLASLTSTRFRHMLSPERWSLRWAEALVPGPTCFIGASSKRPEALLIELIEKGQTFEKCKDSQE